LAYKKTTEKGRLGIGSPALRKALKEARYNERAAVKNLGLTYHQFRGIYRKYCEKIEE
jgi:hypothetical protein